MKRLLIIPAIACTTLAFTNTANATWVGVIGYENAKTVQPTSKKEVQQVEFILNGFGKKFAGLTWDNTTAVKINREANVSIARNWAYGYWNENFGVSVDLIKGDWGGTGPNIGSVGLAYKNCFDKLCVRVNPALATISNKLSSGDTFTDQGGQLNLRMDYKIHDRVSLRFHPQYANWKTDKMGSTLKVEFSATFDLTHDKRHKLSLVHEAFVVNNEATGGKTRYVGEDSPIAGYVPGTEATYKIRYAYVF